MKGLEGEGEMGDEPAFLIVDDEPDLARNLARLFRAHGAAVVAHSLSEARAARSRHANLAGLCLDQMLPDGLGLDWLGELRDAGDALPTVILSGITDHDVLNQAQLLNASFLNKPVGADNIAQFACQAMRWWRAQRPEPSLDQVARAAASRWNLTARHLEILRLALGGQARCDMAEQLGVTENTVKTHIGELLRRTGAHTVRELVVRVLGDQLGE